MSTRPAQDASPTLGAVVPCYRVRDKVLDVIAAMPREIQKIYPTNGYTAIDASLIARLPLARIARDYFFESALLFRLNTIGAVVADVPMAARYGGETSSLRVLRVIASFAGRHVRNFVKRIVYNYFLRDFHLASVELLIGMASLGFGTIFGLVKWIENAGTGTGAATGTIMLAALTTLVGVQMLLAFLNFDIAAVPRIPMHPNYRRADDIEWAHQEQSDRSASEVGTSASDRATVASLGPRAGGGTPAAALPYRRGASGQAQ